MTKPMDITSFVDPHAAIVDVLLRFGAGTDEGDVATLKSAFADEAIVDFSACGRKLDVVFEPLCGIAAIVGFLEGTSRRHVTSHAVTNSRTRLEDDRAHLRSLVEATHLVRDDPTCRFRMMNWYDVDLVLIDEFWRIIRMGIDNIWSEGDPNTLLLR